MVNASEICRGFFEATKCDFSAQLCFDFPTFKIARKNNNFSDCHPHRISFFGNVSFISRNMSVYFVYTSTETLQPLQQWDLPNHQPWRWSTKIPLKAGKSTQMFVNFLFFSNTSYHAYLQDLSGLKKKKGLETKRNLYTFILCCCLRFPEIKLSMEPFIRVHGRNWCMAALLLFVVD